MRRTNLRNVGSPNTPQEIKSLRRSVGDLLRAYGQPVVHMHIYNARDVENGVAKACPKCFDNDLKSARGNCTVCYGVGFVSKDDHLDKWIEEDLSIVDYNTGIPAPLFGGFAEPVLTWVVEPDVSLDVFKVNEQGVLVRTQQAASVAYFEPYMGDNDLMINVDLAQNGYTINNVGDRYELKAVQQNTIRGQGARTGNPIFNVNQTFEMDLLPIHDIRMKVPVGGVEWGKL